MRNILIVLFLSLSVFAKAFSPILEYYVKIDGKWYFGFNGRYTEVVGADPSTFQSIGRYEAYFAKDKNYVYWRHERIEGANPETFVIVSTVWSKDDKNVFLKTKKINNADAKTFELIGSIFTPNYGHHGIGFAKDKNYVFQNGVVTPYDVVTFRLLPWGFMVDKSGIYYRGHLLKGASPKNFRAMDIYMISNNKVFYEDTEIKGADAASFRIVMHRDAGMQTANHHRVDFTIAKDKTGIYINGEAFRNIDVETFRIVTSPIRPPNFGSNEKGEWVDRNAVIMGDKNGIYRIVRLPYDGVVRLIDNYRGDRFTIVPIE